MKSNMDEIPNNLEEFIKKYGIPTNQIKFDYNINLSDNHNLILTKSSKFGWKIRTTMNLILQGRNEEANLFYNGKYKQLREKFNFVVIGINGKPLDG